MKRAIRKRSLLGFGEQEDHKPSVQQTFDPKTHQTIPTSIKDGHFNFCPITQEPSTEDQLNVLFGKRNALIKEIRSVESNIERIRKNQHL